MWGVSLKIVIVVFFFIFGLLAGSFVGSLIWRIHKGKKILFSKKSICPSCGHRLFFWDLIPIFSYILLKGRCRYCKRRIDPLYLFVELGSGLVFTLLGYFWVFQMDLVDFFAVPYPTLHLSAVDKTIYLLQFILSTLVFVGLIFFAFYDLKHRKVPLRMIYIFAIPCVLWLVSVLSTPLLKIFMLTYLPTVPIFIRQPVYYLIIDRIAGITLLPLLFFLLRKATKGKGFGEGDVFFSPLIGVFLGGVLSSIALWLSFVLGGLVSTVWALIEYRRIRDVVVPYLPFLCLSTVFVFTFQYVIIRWILYYFWL